MTALFTINFRREAYLQEVARRRHRVAALAVWVAYFGVLVVLLGLYGLNCASLARRVHLLEHQTVQVRRMNRSQVATRLGSTELALVERYASSTRRWRDRLARLGDVLPADAHLTSLTVNPQNLSDAASQNSLVISGELNGTSVQDRMQGVMKIVSSLRSDSLFRAGYGNIKLSSTRVTEDGAAEFTIECR